MVLFIWKNSPKPIRSFRTFHQFSILSTTNSELPYFPPIFNTYHRKLRASVLSTIFRYLPPQTPSFLTFHRFSILSTVFRYFPPQTPSFRTFHSKLRSSVLSTANSELLIWNFEPFFIVVTFYFNFFFHQVPNPLPPSKALAAIGSVYISPGDAAFTKGVVFC